MKNNDSLRKVIYLFLKLTQQNDSSVCDEWKLIHLTENIKKVLIEKSLLEVQQLPDIDDVQREHHIPPGLIPKENSAESLLDALDSSTYESSMYMKLSVHVPKIHKTARTHRHRSRKIKKVSSHKGLTWVSFERKWVDFFLSEFSQYADLDTCPFVHFLVFVIGVYWNVVNSTGITLLPIEHVRSFPFFDEASFSKWVLRQERAIIVIQKWLRKWREESQARNRQKLEQSLYRPGTPEDIIVEQCKAEMNTRVSFPKEYDKQMKKVKMNMSEGLDLFPQFKKNTIFNHYKSHWGTPLLFKDVKSNNWLHSIPIKNIPKRINKKTRTPLRQVHAPQSAKQHSQEENTESFSPFFITTKMETPCRTLVQNVNNRTLNVMCVPTQETVLPTKKLHRKPMNVPLHVPSVFPQVKYGKKEDHPKTRRRATIVKKPILDASDSVVTLLKHQVLPGVYKK